MQVSNKQPYAFTSQEIKDALQNAMERLFEQDDDLIVWQGSERAQVHWIAIYFDEEIRKTNTYLTLEKDQQERLRVDVEYNRYSVGVKSVKRIEDVCAYCEKKQNGIPCRQFDDRHKDIEEGKYGSITVDMVFHIRGEQEANIFCLEVKPYGTGRPLECDQIRVRLLVKNEEDEERHKPQYRFGAAVHIEGKSEASCVFYEDGQKDERFKIISKQTKQ